MKPNICPTCSFKGSSRISILVVFVLGFMGDPGLGLSLTQPSVYKEWDLATGMLPYQNPQPIKWEDEKYINEDQDSNWMSSSKEPTNQKVRGNSHPNLQGYPNQWDQNKSQFHNDPNDNFSPQEHSKGLPKKQNGNHLHSKTHKNNNPSISTQFKSTKETSYSKFPTTHLPLRGSKIRLSSSSNAPYESNKSHYHNSEDEGPFEQDDEGGDQSLYKAKAKPKHRATVGNRKQIKKNKLNGSQKKKFVYDYIEEEEDRYEPTHNTHYSQDEQFSQYEEPQEFPQWQYKKKKQPPIKIYFNKMMKGFNSICSSMLPFMKNYARGRFCTKRIGQSYPVQFGQYKYDDYAAA